MFLADSMIIMHLEVRKREGEILFRGLKNVIYPDGRALHFSGYGKTDIISISITNDYSLITPVASNIKREVSDLDPPGFLQFNKNKFPFEQTFPISDLYDNLFDSVELLLAFEDSRFFQWNQDYSKRNHTMIFNQIRKRETDIFYFGKRSYVAEFLSRDSSSITSSSSISLSEDFTIEFFLSYEFESELNTGIQHLLFSSSDLSLIYQGLIDFNSTDNSNELLLTIKNLSLSFKNPIRIFKEKLGYYSHFAIVRKEDKILFFIEGILESITPSTSLGTINISNLEIKGFRGLFNSLRITSKARYDKNFFPPSMYFGYLAPFKGDKLLKDIVLNKWYFPQEVSNVVAYSFFGS